MMCRSQKKHRTIGRTDRIQVDMQMATIGPYLHSGQNMQAIAIHQAKNNFSALIHAVEEGEEVVLTRHGKRVARIVLDKEQDISVHELQVVKAAEAKAMLARIRSKVKPGAPMDWRSARDAGRKY